MTLIERLREMNSGVGCGCPATGEAADEIERLQFILEVIKNNDPRLVEIAEQALSRKTGK